MRRAGFFGVKNSSSHTGGERARAREKDRFAPLMNGHGLYLQQQRQRPVHLLLTPRASKNRRPRRIASRVFPHRSVRFSGSSPDKHAAVYNGHVGRIEPGMRGTPRINAVTCGLRGGEPFVRSGLRIVPRRYSIVYTVSGASGRLHFAGMRTSGADLLVWRTGGPAKWPSGRGKSE